MILYMKNIIYIFVGILLGISGSVFAGDYPDDYKFVVKTEVVKTIVNIKAEKDLIDIQASKYAQLYDSCKNK